MGNTVNQNNKTRIRRFSPVQRLFHFLLVVSFLTQGATGLARMYIETTWGLSLAWVFGGYHAALSIHKVVGVMMVIGFGIHSVYLLMAVNWRNFPRCLISPESILPQPKDILDFFRHIGWFLGLGKMPKFDRWGYWEKFDYWAVFWGMMVMGVTGLFMAYSLIVTLIFPGWVLNIVFWIHRIEGILAMGHVFIIHFFIGHLRRHNFPMDRTMFEGSVDLNSMRHEKPVWINRLEESGELNDRLVPPASLAMRIVYYAFGYSAIAVGLYLLIGGLIFARYITW